MGTHRAQCDTWDKVKTKLWNIIYRELKSLVALIGAPPAWTVDEQDPAIETLEMYTSMRMKPRCWIRGTSAKDRRYLVKNQHKFDLHSVYKYGNEISSSQTSKISALVQPQLIVEVLRQKSSTRT
ncbi:hypothetical protein GN244_ATG06422 [Phytophthora infestans]|uniref:Uncharacterized protein n=1 Tax=Phytophthora infestans TaxID=4787 RepID=A0A833SXI6_PHYIN|nr:hypothetical protein GN244_ATG06422 [Phytophthora infestans]KAF4129155.1 hypothetical protein GN958_ATG21651 [Phytophthora infestans]